MVRCFIDQWSLAATWTKKKNLETKNNSTREMNKQTSEQEESRKFFGDHKPHGPVFF